MTYTPEEIRKASDAVRRVEEIDKTIMRIGQESENNLEKWGKEARDIFGRNRLSQLTDAHLGDTLFCGVVNALLAERARIVESVAGIVAFPDPPCPPQQVQDPD